MSSIRRQEYLMGENDVVEFDDKNAMRAEITGHVQAFISRGGSIDKVISTKVTNGKIEGSWSIKSKNSYSRANIQ